MLPAGEPLIVQIQFVSPDGTVEDGPQAIVGDHALGIAFRADTIGVETPTLELGDGAGHGIRGNVVRRVLHIGDVASTFEQLEDRRVNVFGDRKNAEYSPQRPGN